MKAEAIEHWSQCLRCTICFSCLRDPHTLECGHTFCRGCLKQLAQVAHADHPEVRRRRLNMACPACRHKVPARPALKGRNSVNINMKNMLDLWERECRMLLTSGVVKVKSACTQTSDEQSELSGSEDGKGEHNQPKKPGEGKRQQYHEPKQPGLGKRDYHERLKKSTGDGKGEHNNETEKQQQQQQHDGKRKQNNEAEEKQSDGKGELTPPEGQNEVKATEYIRPPAGYLQVLLRRVGEFTEDLKELERAQQNIDENAAPACDVTPSVDVLVFDGAPPPAPADTADPLVEGEREPREAREDSSSGSETDTSNVSSTFNAPTTGADADHSNSEVSLSELVGYITMPRFTFRREFTTVRVSFIVLWCMFSAYVVSLGDNGLPYVAIATLFMFLLCLG